MSTDLDMTTVLYRKEKYACHLDIKPERQRRRDPVHVEQVMTRWLARCVRDQPVITGTAHPKEHEDFLTGQWMLRAWVYAFQDVQPEDREALTRWVDRQGIDAVRIPRFAENLTGPAKAEDARAQKNAPPSGDSA